MKVKDLIKQLEKQDPEKEVFIQQGEEQDYMTVYTVRECEIIPEDFIHREIDEVVNAVVIDYM